MEIRTPSDDRPVDSADEESLKAIAAYDRDTSRPVLASRVAYLPLRRIGMRDKSKKWNPLSASEFKSHASILDKLSVLEKDPRLSFMMKDYEANDPG